MFDDDESEFWQTSLLVNIKDNFEIDYIPILKDGFSIKLANEESKIKYYLIFIVVQKQLNKKVL